MIYGKWISNDEEFAVADNILTTVFSNEIKNDSNFLHKELDSMSNHIIAIDTPTGNAVGYGRITYDLEYFVIDNVCVLPEYRNKYYGDFIVRILVDKGIQCGANTIYCCMPESLKNFFASIGFHLVENPATIAENLHLYDNYIIMCLNPSDFHSKCGCH